jgi:hypothetical protein
VVEATLEAVEALTGVAERDAGSYLEPAGFVYRRDGALNRQIGPVLRG